MPLQALHEQASSLPQPICLLPLVIPPSKQTPGPLRLGWRCRQRGHAECGALPPQIMDLGLEMIEAQCCAQARPGLYALLLFAHCPASQLLHAACWRYQSSVGASSDSAADHEYSVEKLLEKYVQEHGLHVSEISAVKSTLLLA